MTVDRHMPAPLIVTLFTAMWPGILKVPSGIHTVPPAPAAWLAALNPAVAPAPPAGSAARRRGRAPGPPPRGGRAGARAGPATLSKSAKSIVVFVVAVSRNLV